MDSCPHKTYNRKGWFSVYSLVIRIILGVHKLLWMMTQLFCGHDYSIYFLLLGFFPQNYCLRKFVISIQAVMRFCCIRPLSGESALLVKYAIWVLQLNGFVFFSATGIFFRTFFFSVVKMNVKKCYINGDFLSWPKWTPFIC